MKALHGCTKVRSLKFVLSHRSKRIFQTVLGTRFVIDPALYIVGYLDLSAMHNGCSNILSYISEIHHNRETLPKPTIL